MNQDRVIAIHEASGRRIELPVLAGTQGPSVIDVRSLNSTLGMHTYDPGFVSTASCRSAITYIDGDRGILLYRGYPVEQLAEHSSHLEVCYLLQYGELPSAAELAAFERSIRAHTSIPARLRQFYFGFPREAHPMAMLLGVVGALSSFYHERFDLDDPASREKLVHQILAQMPILAAGCHRYAAGKPFSYPQPTLGYVENLLHMLFAPPTGSAEIHPTRVRALDMILLLHADHEQNASTSSVRLVSSSGANPFAALAAGVASLWGPAHGGANEAVIRMLSGISSVREVPALVRRAKDKSDGFRLSGFGHRVYKNHDPRARIIRRACHELLESINPQDDPLFEIALELERIALKDDYFQERKLYPNVDFYSGIMLRALDIPINMFTVIFALARTAGWLSQWLEMREDPEYRIGRPRQLYVGPPRRDYQPMAQRFDTHRQAL